jgi:hypothetical protein
MLKMFYAYEMFDHWRILDIKTLLQFMYLFFTKIIKFLLTYNCNFAYDCDTTDYFVKFYIYTINTV